MAAKPPATIDEYLASFPKNVQQILQHIRRQVHAAVPDVSETISYGIPTFKLRGTYLIYMAGFSKHVSIYPIHLVAGPLGKKLAPYITGKGTAQFKLDKPVPYDVIDEVIALRKHQTETKE